LTSRNILKKQLLILILLSTKTLIINKFMMNVSNLWLIVHSWEPRFHVLHTVKLVQEKLIPWKVIS